MNLAKGKGKKSSSGKSTPQKQALILWALLVQEGSGAFQHALKPDVSKADRDALEKAGLVTSKTKGRKLWIEVTERGWAWAGDHLDHELPSGSSAGTPILRAWLTRLKAYMEARNVPLAEVLVPPLPKTEGATVTATGQPGYEALRARIRQAYFAVTGNRAHTRARLSEVRQKLGDIDRRVLDDALTRMQREQQATLFPLDDKAEITDADRSAAIYFGDQPRHILWIER